MARIRTIKPEFWTSEQVVECSTNARLLFVGMWNFCDDQGVHPASTKRLKMEIFPADNFTDAQINSMVDELITHDLLRYFEYENQGYWWVTGWHHQKIDRPSNKHPSPPKFVECSTSAPRILDDHSPPEGKGKEGKGKEEKELANANSKKKVSLDELSLDHIADWLADKRRKGQYRDHDEHRILEVFKDYCRAKGKTYKDYIPALKNAFDWNRNQPKPQNQRKYGNEPVKTNVPNLLAQ